jgi:ABC-type antimicrobial peptide transport system permease subunit
VLKNGMSLAVGGVVLGLLGGAALARFLETFLYGVGALDPMTYTAVALLLLGVALVATWVPARRASRVDPLIAIRAE